MHWTRVAVENSELCKVAFGLPDLLVVQSMFVSCSELLPVSIPDLADLLTYTESFSENYCIPRVSWQSFDATATPGSGQYRGGDCMATTMGSKKIANKSFDAITG
jgi:hypothetical protein